MGDIKSILISELNAYAGKAFNGEVYLTSNADQNRFVVTAVGQVKGERVVNTSLMVQLADNRVIIDQDTNSKPLVDALLQAGIPRQQIILAYAGEPVPETV